MIAVVVVGVCLVIALRIFSTCAAIVSEAQNRTLALKILQEKMDELQEEAIINDGIEVSCASEEITLNNRKLNFTKDVTIWEPPPAEEEEEERYVSLNEVTLDVKWGARGKTRNIKVKTIIPAKGFRHEF